jgi:hypothetical protein
LLKGLSMYVYIQYCGSLGELHKSPGWCWAQTGYTSCDLYSGPPATITMPDMMYLQVKIAFGRRIALAGPPGPTPDR